MSRFYISDLHFYHDSLNRQMDCRGFADRDAMNAHMIAQWNSRVRPEDEVVILGDFSVARGPATNAVASALNGKLYLIEGNHDEGFLKDKKFDRSRFEWIKPYAELHDCRRKVILSHYPMVCYNRQYRRGKDGNPRTWMLYGHVHNTEDERLVRTFREITRKTLRRQRREEEPLPIPCQMINCFCMFSDYIPLTLDEWIAKDAQRSAAMACGAEEDGAEDLEICESRLPTFPKGDIMSLI